MFKLKCTQKQVLDVCYVKYFVGCLAVGQQDEDQPSHRSVNAMDIYISHMISHRWI